MHKTRNKVRKISHYQWIESHNQLKKKSEKVDVATENITSNTLVTAGPMSMIKKSASARQLG